MISQIMTKEVKTMNTMGETQSWIQHHFNSVHVYCRLVRIMPRSLAKNIALWWEETAIYHAMYTSG